MIVKFAGHAGERVRERLNGLVTIPEILKKISIRTIPQGRCYLVAKQMAYCEILDNSVQPDGVARGDIIVVAIDRTGDELRIPTVMLRKSWSKSPEYANLIW